VSKQEDNKSVKPDEITVETKRKAGNPAWVNGSSGNPAGRPKGTKDRVSMQVQEAFAFLVADNLPKFQKWIDKVAEEKPEKAVELMLKIAEYVIPKKNMMDAIERASEDGVQPIAIVFGNKDKQIDEPDNTES